jgi:hypothetical protein
MGRIPAAHRCVMCDSIVPEALAVVVNRVVYLLLYLFSVSIATYYTGHSYYGKDSRCTQICYVRLNHAGGFGCCG